MVRCEAAMRDSKELKAMKGRRVKGARMLLRGDEPARVARTVGVSRQTVMRWERALAEGAWSDWRAWASAVDDSA